MKNIAAGAWNVNFRGEIQYSESVDGFDFRGSLNVPGLSIQNMVLIPQDRLPKNSLVVDTEKYDEILTGWLSEAGARDKQLSHTTDEISKLFFGGVCFRRISDSKTILRLNCDGVPHKSDSDREYMKIVQFYCTLNPLQKIRIANRDFDAGESSSAWARVEYYTGDTLEDFTAKLRFLVKERKGSDRWAQDYPPLTWTGENFAHRTHKLEKCG